MHDYQVSQTKRDTMFDFNIQQSSPLTNLYAKTPDVGKSAKDFVYETPPELTLEKVLIGEDSSLTERKQKLRILSPLNNADGAQKRSNEFMFRNTVSQNADLRFDMFDAMLNRDDSESIKRHIHMGSDEDNKCVMNVNLSLRADESIQKENDTSKNIDSGSNFSNEEVLRFLKRIDQLEPHPFLRASAPNKRQRTDTN